jgi:hypothetical protein
MSAKIIKHSEREFFVEHSLNYDTSSNGGFSFPCDQYGHVDVDSLNEYAKHNYQQCIDGMVGAIRPPYVQEREFSRFTPAIAECECGKRFEMDMDSEGLCYCYCGKCYNAAGQSIRPRSEWQEIWYDDY